MKKTLSLVVALVMVFACFAAFATTVAADDANREFTVYRVSTAPAIDGVIDDGEYPLVSSWPDDTEMTAKGDYVANIEAYLYMCYDEDFLYYAVKTECDAPHTAMMDNAAQHYVFNAHNIMTCLIPDDPSNGSYPDGSATWSDLYNGGYCYEWTMIYTSEAVTGGHEANVPFATDHFRDLIAGAKATYSTGSADGWDCYEVKIPWSAMSSTTQPTALVGEEGTKFGFDFNIGLTNINDDADVIANGGYDGANGVYKGNYLVFADCYSGTSKNLQKAAVMTLGGDSEIIVDPSEPEEPSSEEPSSEEEEPSTPAEEDSIISNGKSYVVYGAGSRGDAWDDTNGTKLTDGVFCAADGATATVYGMGINEANPSVVIDLGASTEISSFLADLTANQAWGIADPATFSVIFSVSENGESFTDVGTVAGSSLTPREGAYDGEQWVIYDFILNAEATGRYVKVTYNTNDVATHVWASEIAITAAAGDEPTPPPTGDAGMIALAVVSVIALAGAVVIKKR